MSAHLRAKANRVYRLRGVPVKYDLKALDVAFENALQKKKATVKIHSLARDFIHHEVQTATITFRGKLSGHLSNLGNFIKRTFPDEDIGIDDTFESFTPLHNPTRDVSDVINIIFVPGLASHPLVTFAANLCESPFVWIRDEVQRYIPNARTFTWGYQSQVVDSVSCQNLTDLGEKFCKELDTLYYDELNQKPLMLVGVSLGGLIIQQAICLLASRSNPPPILLQICHLFMFGVPKQGMRVNHLKKIVGQQPNWRLVASLEQGSETLKNLRRDFYQKFSSKDTDRDSQIYSFYELLETPQLIKNAENKPVSEGDSVLLVDQASATYGRDGDEMGEEYTCGLQKTHQNLVRFAKHETELVTVLRMMKKASLSAVGIVQKRMVASLLSYMEQVRPRTQNQKSHLWFTVTQDSMNRYREVYQWLPHNPNGSVEHQTFLDAIGNSRIRTTVDWVWKSVKSNREPLSKNLLLAVLFMLHLIVHDEGCRDEFKKQPDWSYEINGWTKKRYEVLKRFDDWATCACNANGKPCGLMWNFANDLGMYREKWEGADKDCQMRFYVEGPRGLVANLWYHKKYVRAHKAWEKTMKAWRQVRSLSNRPRESEP